jgi:hypothetical protein
LFIARTFRSRAWFRDYRQEDRRETAAIQRQEAQSAKIVSHSDTQYEPGKLCRRSRSLPRIDRHAIAPPVFSACALYVRQRCLVMMPIRNR